ncbi:MAG: S9 family peptidase [Kangiellaceae bacterium]|jgi:dipeptidyl aminopeptidase/acylaminoacyl peptidase|nr:S9 family peptidase [Kangiellaceae bacterium]
MTNQISHKTIREYGAWPSDIAPSLLASNSVKIGHCQTFEESFYWLEFRPAEKGRGVIVKSNGAEISDVLPSDISVKSKVHEYGGADFFVSRKGIFFSNGADREIYCFHNDHVSKVTSANQAGIDCRFTDFTITADEKFLFCVRETHRKRDVINDIVRVDLSSGSIEVVVSGADFYSDPKVSPDGNYLCWLSWSHPNMPWDSTNLTTAKLQNNKELVDIEIVAGGPSESVSQPRWSNDNVIYFLSDRSGYSNLYSMRDGILNALTPMANDIGVPQWNFGLSSYTLVGDDIYFSFFQTGQQQLAHLDTSTGVIEPASVELTEFYGQIHWLNGNILALAGSPTRPLDLYKIELSRLDVSAIKSNRFVFDRRDYSIAEPISFVSSDAQTVYGFYYPPLNKAYQANQSSLPPLIVLSHSGPTSYTTSTFNWTIQFWTNRGFAVVDVNYRGSTGFGRDYKDQLNSRWGEIDVDDCVYAARYLVDHGRVDKNKLIIRGGSAGGFTTLNALTKYQDFACAMVRYAVSDLSALMAGDHKFEAEYLTSLIGDPAQHKQRYRKRSPINNVERLSTPMLVLQGADDVVVPPEQSKELVKALVAKKIPHRYIEFAGEGHGFRQQETIIKAFEAELAFYQECLAIS